MKTFLSTVKGKIIAGAITLVVIAAAIVTIVLLNTGYRTIRVDDLNGTTEITKGASVTEAVKGQNLKSECKVFVQESSDLTLELDEDKHVFADELTCFSLEAVGKPGKDSRTVIKLDEGSVLSEIDEKLGEDESYIVESPNAAMAVRGTTFTVTVSYDDEGLCHTIVEVEEGTVEVTEKDENGDPTDEVQTLKEGEKTEVISLVIKKNEDDETPSGGNNSPTNNSSTPEQREAVYQDPEALAVENAIEAYLNGSPLDTTNFDRVSTMFVYGRVALVSLDGYKHGKSMPNTIHIITGNKFVHLTGNTGDDSYTIKTDYNALTNLDFCRELTEARCISIGYGGITDISGVSELNNLKFLYLYHNPITDITPVSNLKRLEILDLSNTPISNVSPAAKAPSIKHIVLSRSNFTDFSQLIGMNNLESITLFDIPITDPSPLLELPSLKQISGVKKEEDKAKLQQLLPNVEIN